VTDVSVSSLRAVLALLAAGVAVGACGNGASTQAPTTASPAVPTTPFAASAPVPIYPSTPAAAGLAGPNAATVTPVPSDSTDAAAIPTEAPKCVAFVTGPRAGAIGPATVHIRTTTPRAAVSMRVQTGQSTQQLVTQTDDSGLAVQSLAPLPAGASEDVAVSVGDARCSAIFPPR